MRKRSQRSWQEAAPTWLRAWWCGYPRTILEDGGALLLPSLLALEPDDRLLVVSGRASDVTAEALSARVGLKARAVTMVADEAGRRAHPAPDGAGVVRAQADALPFNEAAFSVLLAGHVARSWDDERLLRFLREAWRVLAHNGVIVLWEVAPSRSARVNAIWRRVLAADGGRVELRNFAALGRLGREAGFAWIQTLALRPFLWPPGPRVSVLMRKEHYTGETVDPAGGVVLEREAVVGG